MKFVALALALLLAVGSQAAPMMADAPSQLQHYRAAADMYLTQVIGSITKALDQTGDSEITPYLKQSLNGFSEYVKHLQAQVSPMTDTVASTVADTFTDLRANIESEINTLKEETKVQVNDVKDIVRRHMEEYRQLLLPVMTEYQIKHNQEMAQLKMKLQPVIEQLRERMNTNVEETKTALIPILEKVTAKVVEVVESVKESVVKSPYVEEYKEQLKLAYTQGQSFQQEDLTALKEKISPLAGEVKKNLQQIFEAVAATIMKN